MPRSRATGGKQMSNEIKPNVDLDLYEAMDRAYCVYLHFMEALDGHPGIEGDEEIKNQYEITSQGLFRLHQITAQRWFRHLGVISK
jgi:hypothetical protein